MLLFIRGDLVKIGIANDHAGTQLKLDLIEYLKEKGHEVKDYGTDSFTKSDYPLQGELLGNGVKNKEVDLGIGICGTGLGISYACNKVKGIRAAVCSETTSASLARLHNDANIVCFGSRIIGIELAKDIVDTFINTAFSNEERHIKRINMIKDIENRQ